MNETAISPVDQATTSQQDTHLPMSRPAMYSRFPGYSMMRVTRNILAASSKHAKQRADDLRAQAASPSCRVQSRRRKLKLAEMYDSTRRGPLRFSTRGINLALAIAAGRPYSSVETPLKKPSLGDPRIERITVELAEDVIQALCNMADDATYGELASVNTQAVIDWAGGKQFNVWERNTNADAASTETPV